MAKGELAHNEQFLLLSHCFQLDSLNIRLFTENVHGLSSICSKSSAACGEGLKNSPTNLFRFRNGIRF